MDADDEIIRESCFLNSDDINSPQRGVSDEGLSMTEFPTATDDMHSVNGMQIGKLYGDMQAVIPAGLYLM